jgi:hypothetical protein
MVGKAHLPGYEHLSDDALRWDDIRAPATGINPPRRLGGDAADTYGADSRLYEVDCHYINDSSLYGGGSLHEFIKQGHRR